MHEKQRFAIALAGIGVCLGIAAGIVVTGPPVVTTAPVADAPMAAGAPGLPNVPMPSWDDSGTGALPMRTNSNVLPATNRTVLARVAAVAPAAPVNLGTSVVNRQFTSPSLAQSSSFHALPLAVASRPVPLSDAPRATGADIVLAEHRTRERGVVTGAFVTAGAHVGESFKTVGRTLRRVF
jgi:hypothetical protein